MKIFGLEILSRKSYDVLTETQTKIMRALEDLDWVNLNEDKDISIFLSGGVRRAIKESKIFWYNNPLAGHWVNLTTWFVFGEGISKPKSKDKDIQAIIDEFWEDPDNKLSLTSYQAQIKLSNKIQYEGNLFFLLFDDEEGNVRVRVLNTEEIKDIIKNPEDKMRTDFYKTMQMIKEYDFRSDSFITKGNAVVYYPDKDTFKPEYYGIPGNKLGQARIYHVAINADINDKYGIPELFRGNAWMKAHKDMAGDLATFIKSLAKFAWKKKVKGTQAQINTLKAALKARTDLKNIGPSTGSTQLENEGVNLQAINTPTGGVKNSTEGLKSMQLMVSAASGTPYQYFGDPSCYDKETMVLTEKGWIKHKDWINGIKIASYNPQTNFQEYIEPEELRIFNYKGKMISFQNKQTDIVVTPNHRMFAAPVAQRKRKTTGDKYNTVGRRYRFIEAQDILKSERTHGWRIINTASYEGTIEYKNKDFMKLAGYYLSEGHLTKTKKGSFVIGLSQNEGETLNNMRAVVKSLGYKWHETSNQTGCITLNICNKKLYNKLLSMFGKLSGNKFIDKEIFEYDFESRWALYQAMMEGNGGKAGRGCFRYSTKSKRLADDFQILAMGLGFGVSIKLERQGKVSIYKVLLRCHWKTSIILPKHIKQIDYNDKVYCFHVPPHHLYITRRNGKTAIQGNTGNLATAKTMELPLLKKYLARQKLFQDIYNTILQYVIDRKISVGMLEGEEIIDEKNQRVIYKTKRDRAIDLDFPPITEADLKEAAEAYTKAKDGKLISSELASQLFMLDANVNNIDQEIKKLIAEVANEKKTAEPEPVKTDEGIKNKILAKPLKEAVSQAKPDRFVKKSNFLQGRLNAFKKAIGKNFNKLRSDINKNLMINGINGNIVGLVKDFDGILNKFALNMQESAKIYFPEAIDIGTKYMQSILKEKGIKIEETIFEKNKDREDIEETIFTLNEIEGRGKTLLEKSLNWNEEHLKNSLIPDIKKKVNSSFVIPAETAAALRAAVNESIDSFEGRISLYVGAFWTVEENAVKEAGRDTNIMANFAGAEDEDNCAGCRAALNGNPWNINDIPVPGELDCLGNCRHAIQVI